MRRQPAEMDAFNLGNEELTILGEEESCVKRELAIEGKAYLIPPALMKDTETQALIDNTARLKFPADSSLKFPPLLISNIMNCKTKVKCGSVNSLSLIYETAP